jgi:hypothetical protein
MLAKRGEIECHQKSQLDCDANAEVTEKSQKKHDYSLEFCFVRKCLIAGFLRDLYYANFARDLCKYIENRPNHTGSKRGGFPPGFDLENIPRQLNRGQLQPTHCSRQGPTRIERIRTSKVAETNAFFRRFFIRVSGALGSNHSIGRKVCSSLPSTIASSTDPTNLTICSRAGLWLCGAIALPSARLYTRQAELNRRELV